MEMKKLEVISLIGLTLVAGYLSEKIFSIDDIYALVKNRIQVEGTVVEKREAEHQAIVFKYFVDGQEYSGGGRASNFDKDFANISIGDKVPVYYDAKNHANASLGDPRRIFYSNIRGAILLSLAPCFLYLGYRAKKKWFPT